MDMTKQRFTAWVIDSRVQWELCTPVNGTPQILVNDEVAGQDCGNCFVKPRSHLYTLVRVMRRSA